MRIIDSHHHLWDLNVRAQDWITGDALRPLRRNFTPADYEATARNAGVAASIVVQTVTVPEETPELLALAADSDLIAGVVGWADLTDPSLAARIETLMNLPGGDTLVGLRHQVQLEPNPNWLTRPDVLRGLAVLAEAGLVYDLVITPPQLSAAAEAAAAVPGLTFVLDHLGKPPIASGTLQPWRDDLQRLAALPNTYGKLSGLVTEADWYSWKPADLRPFADAALEVFGPNRLMFGSDWPVCTLAADYVGVLGAARDQTDQLTSDERAAIFAGTAAQVYRLR